MTKWHFNAKLCYCCSPEENLIPASLLSTVKPINVWQYVVILIAASFIFLHMTALKQKWSQTACVKIHPSGIKDICQSLITGELI